MTQPVYPALLPQSAPPLLPTLPTAPLQPVAPAGAVAPPPLSAREQAAAIDAQRAAREAKHGAGETAATQFGRGALDALLAPGALAGAGIEGIGELAGWEGWRDFGRDLGRSSTGAEFLSVISATPELVTGDGAAAYDQYRRGVAEIHEQEQAWPMLSAVSRVAGAVAFGVAVGAGAGAATKAQQMGLAAFEGAGFGAQSGYEKNAPLRDVITSTLIGGTLGAGLTAAVAKGVPYLQRHAQPALRELADESALKAAGFSGPDFRRMVRGLRGEAAEAKIGDVGQDLLIYRLQTGPNAGKKILRAGRKADDMAGDLGTAVKEMGEQIGAVRKTIDRAMQEQPDLAPEMTAFFQRVDDEILRPLKASDSPAMVVKAEKIERSLQKLREAYDVRDLARAGDPVRVRTKSGAVETRARVDPGPPRTFEQLDKFRRDLGDEIYPKAPSGGGIPPAAPEHAFELLKVERMLADHLDDAAEGALGRMGLDTHGFRDLKRIYSNFRDLSEVGTKAQLQGIGNRAVSLTDYMTALTAGNIAGIPAGLATAFGHKVLRERGRSTLAVVADLLAGHGDDAGHAVSVAAAGGREAQEVITKIDRARRIIRDIGEVAGPNPAASQAARRQAQQDVGDVLAKEAGPFDANWIKKPPTTLQKVLHRGQILDQVSTDTAAAVQKVAALRPTLASSLNQRRLVKLLKDADGPAAIGGVQMRIAKLLEQLPRSMEGEALRGGLKAYSLQLQTAGTAETMRTAHDLVLRFSQAAKVATDPSVKAFSARAAAELAQDLSAPAWGQAGQLYGKLSGAPQDALGVLSDPAVLRDALRMTELRGRLSGAARQGTEAIREAQKAAAELSGYKPTGETEFKALERLFERAEEAVTLDGGPVNRVLDYFAQKLDERVAGSLGAGVTRALGDQPGHVAETAVAHAVRSRLGKLSRVLHTAGHTAEHAGIHTAQSSAIGAATEGKAATKAGRPLLAATAGAAGAGIATRALLTPQEKQQQFRSRSELVAQAVADPELDLSEGLAAVRAIAPGLDTVAAADFREKLEKLHSDMPKIRQGFRGPEMPSSQEVRLANAMFEATTDPLSVFDDLASGSVDYDKAKYAKEQYPGLFEAAAFGIQDVLFHQMGEEQRAVLPENILTQLDHLLGLEGGLQQTSAHEFIQTVDMVAQQAASKQKPDARKPLELPGQALTPPSRIAQARR